MHIKGDHYVEEILQLTGSLNTFDSFAYDTPIKENVLHNANLYRK